MRRNVMTDWKSILEAEPVDERRFVSDMCCDIRVYRQCRSLILIPGRDVRVLPSGHFNKDFVQSPVAITNNGSMGNRVEMCMMGQPLSVNDSFVSRSLSKMDLDPERCVAFGTAAHMNNAVVRNIVSRNGVKISAAITGGVRGNGGRAGDPASFDESKREYAHKSGTIVIILAVEAKLTDSAMLEAMMTVTQAKSCVLQELCAKSLYSPRIATGSGTDQVGIVSLTESDTVLTSAGPGTDVGIAMGECVRDALAKTLDLQSGMNSETQCDPFVMLSRFGIPESAVHDEIRYPSTMASLLRANADMHADRELAASVSAILHIADDVNLGRIDNESGVRTARRIAEATMLKDVPIDPVSTVVMDGIGTVPELVGYAMAMILRHRAVLSEVRK